MESQNILLVETDDHLAEGLVAFLQMRGFEVDHIRDGSKGLEVAKQKKPDLVLSSHFMRPVDGIELLRSLRSDPDTVDVPFVLMSTSLSSSHEEESRARGADAYFSKPFSLNDLAQRIEGLLEGRQ